MTAILLCVGAVAGGAFLGRVLRGWSERYPDDTEGDQT